jgi:hypothetical protein
VVKDVTSPWKMNDRGTAWQKIKPGTLGLDRSQILTRMMPCL